MADTTKTYQFVNSERWGADYVEFFVREYENVSYTLIQTEECKGIVFEMDLTEKEKDELLSCDGTHDIEGGFCIIETFPSGMSREIVVTGEEDILESKRTPIPDALLKELEMIEDGEIELEDVWGTDEKSKLLIQGKIEIHE